MQSDKEKCSKYQIKSEFAKAIESSRRTVDISKFQVLIRVDFLFSHNYVIYFFFSGDANR